MFSVFCSSRRSLSTCHSPHFPQCFSDTHTPEQQPRKRDTRWKTTTEDETSQTSSATSVASQQSFQPTGTTDRAPQVCAKICAQTPRGGSTRLVSSRVTLTALSSLVKMDRPSRDFRAVCQQFVAANSDGLPYSLKKQDLHYKDIHGCTTVPLPVSVRLVSFGLKFKKSSNSTCTTNFQQTKISRRPWTHSACPSTQFMITKRKHGQKPAKEASDRAGQAFCYSVATVSIPFFNLR